VPLKRRAAPRAEIMVWDGSAWQKALAESSANPNLRVTLYSAGAKIDTGDSTSDARPAVYTALFSNVYGYLFNGSSWDRWRNNTEVTVLPMGTRTTSGNSAEQINYNAKGVMVFLYVSAVSGSFAAGEGLRLRVETRDPASGIWRRLIDYIGPYTTTGLWNILIYPAATDTAGMIDSENDIPLPRRWRVGYTITGTNPSFTFSVGASYIM